MDFIFFFFFIYFVLLSSQRLGFFVLILPCYSFDPCFLLPTRVPFLGVFFFSLSCIIFFCSLRFCWLLPACPHPSHPVFHRFEHGTHMHLLYIHMCAPRRCHSLTPVSCSWRYSLKASAVTVAIPASSQFLEGSFRWERNQKESRTSFWPETENASSDGGWILRNQEKAQERSGFRGQVGDEAGLRDSSKGR